MKTKKASRCFGATHTAKHIVQEQKALAQGRIGEIQSKLRACYAGLERVFAFACGEKTLQKKRCSERARNYQRTADDERRLQWTVENMQKQITQLQQELFQLMRGIQ